MATKAQLWIILFFVPFLAKGQNLTVAPTYNYISPGINILYGKDFAKDQWNYEVGLRYFVNTYSFNENKRNHHIYQGGFAANFLQRWGLVGRIDKKVWKIGKLQVDAMANLLITYSELKEKSFIYNLTSGNWEHQILEFEPAPAFELTVGTKIKYNFSHKLSAYIATGVGILYITHKNEAIDLISGSKAVLVDMGVKYRERGSYGIVGGEGFPMTSIGISYRLPSMK